MQRRTLLLRSKIEGNFQKVGKILYDQKLTGMLHDQKLAGIDRDQKLTLEMRADEKQAMVHGLPKSHLNGILDRFLLRLMALRVLYLLKAISRLVVALQLVV
uniref:Uncharacterized protein n=1 Tax=Glossina pallidipes TaxID=7398 RepID=A0A1A9Z627_GLOPL